MSKPVPRTNKADMPGYGPQELKCVGECGRSKIVIVSIHRPTRMVFWCSECYEAQHPGTNARVAAPTEYVPVLGGRIPGVA